MPRMKKLDGKHFLKKRQVYAVQQYAEIPHRTPVGETMIFRTYKLLNQSLPFFKTNQSVVDHIRRYCTGVNARKYMLKHSKTGLYPQRAYYFIQKVSLYLPVYQKYKPRSTRIISPARILELMDISSIDSSPMQVK